MSSPIFYDELIRRIQEEGSVPENDSRYTAENILKIINSRMTYYITPILIELAVNFFVVRTRVPLSNPDGSPRFVNGVVPFPVRGAGRALREVKWFSQNYEYKIPRKGVENDLSPYTFIPFTYEVIGEGLRIIVYNNNITTVKGGSLIFYYSISPPELVDKNISAPLQQVLYDSDKKRTYFTLNVGGLATDFPTSGQSLIDIVGTNGRAYSFYNTMINYYANDFYGNYLDTGNIYRTYLTDEDIPWDDLDVRQTLGFRILNMPNEGQLVIYCPAGSVNQISLHGYNAASLPVSINISLTIEPQLIPTELRFLNAISLGGSPAIGDIFIDSVSQVGFRVARIPAGIINCKVGTVLPYCTNDVYLNLAKRSSFLVIPQEAVELLILVCALSILQNQGDYEASTKMEERVKKAEATVRAILKDTVVGSPEVVRNDYGIGRFLTNSYRWY